ncbi:MAG: 3D domain-containing protein [Tissierellia bacterium]|nr:3D domain-containing protein [Tissierellia bacterium]
MEKLKIERLIFLICFIICIIALIATGLDVNALENDIQKLHQLNNRQAAQLLDKDLEIELQQLLIEMQDEIIQEHINQMDEPEHIGEFEITYYTAGPESTGKYPGHPEYGITRSGTVVEEGRTIAADWSVLEPGTRVYIEGIGERIVEDTGGLIVDKCIDVYVEQLEDIPAVGRHKANVWIVEEVKECQE